MPSRLCDGHKRNASIASLTEAGACGGGMYNVRHSRRRRRIHIKTLPYNPNGAAAGIAHVRRLHFVAKRDLGVHEYDLYVWAPAARFTNANERAVLSCLCMDEQKSSLPRRWLKERRSERIELSVPVVVYRVRGDGPHFCETTQTLVVSAHGALVPLTQLVVPRQKIHVQNPNSGEQLECCVVSVKRAVIGPPRVALEFTKPAPGFWKLAFPPADWKPLP
jgi:hypothetical protein